MTRQLPVHIKTIAEYHRRAGLPGPEHPLVSLIRFEDIHYDPERAPQAIMHNFYSIALKKSFYARLKYGQQEADFDNGILLFMAPGQILAIEGPFESVASHTGWLLLVHPDLLWNTHLAAKIRRYEYFEYKANEALHLSESEEQLLAGIVQTIAQEYRARIDEHTQAVIVAQLDLLLTYAERFYQRQFITRKTGNHQILIRLESLLNDYVKQNRLQSEGIPSVTFVADALHVSPNYLSRLLTSLTRQSTKQVILSKVIDVAKEKLSTTDLSVSEIAYLSGFEHPQSFCKFFKARTRLSPLAFRQSFT